MTEKSNIFKDKNLVPEYIENLKVYQAGKPIEELIRERNPKQVSKIASNENPLGPSPKAVAAIKNTIKDLHRYPDMLAYKLKGALCEHYKVNPENIILGNGSEGIMAYIARTFIRPGDEVVTSQNTFIGFYIMFRGVGAKLIAVPMTKEYRFDVKEMVSRVNDKTKIVYIANPNNPTGTYITKTEFDYLMDSIPKHCIVMMDEAYYEFAKDRDDYPDSMQYRYDNVITLRTFSKAYGISGIRVGYGLGHPYLMQSLSKVKLPFEPNLLAQVGACGALTDNQHLAATIDNNKIQYQRTINYLNENGFSPIDSVTNFIAFPTGSEAASDWMIDKLMDSGVIIRHMKSNEMPEFVRVSLGTSEEMDHFFEGMDSILSEFNKKFR